jgi:cold shock protein
VCYTPTCVKAQEQRRSFEKKIIEKNCMMTGTIKTLTDKGFGFIAREGEAKDLFFHSKELVGVTFDELQIGDTVSFEIVQSEKGPAATKVSRA